MQIRIETASMSDAIAKAASIAGSDSLAGVLIGSDPGVVTVSATDGELTFRRKISAEAVEMSFGDQDTRRWYLPAKVVSKLFSKFPMGEGSMVSISDLDESTIEIKCNKTKVKLHTLDWTVFPRIVDYDPDILGEVEGMARKLKMVAFAAQPKSKGVLSGLYIDGEFITACNGNQLARVRCKVPVDQPVTLPIAPLSNVLKNTDAVHMGYVDDRFVFQTDAETQVTSTVITERYPDVSAFAGLRDQWCDATTKFSKDVMRMVLERMLALCAEEEYPRVRMRYDADAVRVGMHVPQVGQMTDELPAECANESVLTYTMMPKYLLDVLSAWPSNEVPLEFCSTSNLKPYAIGDDDFLAMWMGVRES